MSCRSSRSTVARWGIAVLGSAALLCSATITDATAHTPAGACRYAPWNSWHTPPTAAEVGQLQCELSYALTSYHGPVTGIFDPSTRQALRRFQSCDGLPADAVYGRATQMELYRVYSSGPLVC
ncbi:peptidoglycan-binding protein [Streptomyces sp. NPDC007172]|uniref:peptidoglycan-binding domain-containing protein n=1 Tax=Streptomyces sp. NPDC007172 TaxID=3364776 RepID=UPI0036C8ED67